MVPKIATSDDVEMDEFVTTLKTQLEIFVNRMKSNSSRGRSITNDSSVQTLFMNTMAMHSKLLKHIQDQEDKRVQYEGLQVIMSQFFILDILLNPFLYSLLMPFFYLGNFFLHTWTIFPHDLSGQL